MSPEPLDGSVIVYDAETNEYSPSEHIAGSSDSSTDALTVVSGGVVHLDDSVSEGTLRSFLVKAPTTFSAVAGTATLGPGIYNFVRTEADWDISSVASGVSISEDQTPADTSYAAVSIAMSPLIALDLDDALNTTTPAQVGSSSAVASTSGPVVFGTREGIGGYAKSADFSDTGKVTFPGSVTANLSALSVTMLLDLDMDPAATCWVIGKDSNKWRIYFSSNNCVFQIDGVNVVAGPIASTLSAPVLLGMTYDGTNIRGYINGVLVGTTPRSGPIPNDSTVTEIGSNIDGAINGVRIWDRVVTGDEMAALATAAGL